MQPFSNHAMNCLCENYDTMWWCCCHQGIEFLSHSPLIDKQERCRICSDAAAGFHCGAFVCEACKKFYIRAQKQSLRGYSCTGVQGIMCSITKETRTSCSYCRFKKCISIGMHPPGTGSLLLLYHSSPFVITMIDINLWPWGRERASFCMLVPLW
mgnify:CR=1 FL=1